MDASRLTLCTWTGLPRTNHGWIFARAGAIALAVGLDIFAVLLFVRRITGAFDRVLPEGVFIASIAIVVVWAAAIRLAMAMAGRDSERTAEQRFLDWSPTLALPLIGVAMAVTGTSAVAILAATALVAGEEYWAARYAPRLRMKSEADRPSRLIVGRAAEAQLIERPNVANVLTQGIVEPVIDVAIHRELWQEQRRFRGESEEMISGVIRCCFAPNDRSGIEHVAFCPPLTTVPQVELEPVDGAACSVRATHVFRYGARIEIKLDDASDQATECLIAFEARSALDSHVKSAPLAGEN